MQILAIDLGTETLPALALGREPAEPGLMHRPPRKRSDNVIDGAMLASRLGPARRRLRSAGHHPVPHHLGARRLDIDHERHGRPPHQVWVQATTVTFLGIVACQIGTAIAARTQRAGLAQIGLFSNRLLLWGIAFEIGFAAAVTLLPPLQRVFGTTALQPWQTLALLPLPFLVWGVDELWRWTRRRHPDQSPASELKAPQAGKPQVTRR